LNAEVDRFLREANECQEEMKLLREIARDSGLDEHIKWGLLLHVARSGDRNFIDCGSR